MKQKCENNFPGRNPLFLRNQPIKIQFNENTYLRWRDVLRADDYGLKASIKREFSESVITMKEEFRKGLFRSPAEVQI
jgi:hypothetical protein